MDEREDDVHVCFWLWDGLKPPTAGEKTPPGGSRLGHQRNVWFSASVTSAAVAAVDGRARRLHHRPAVSLLVNFLFRRAVRCVLPAESRLLFT